MTIQVIKRNGRRAPFLEEKIRSSIALAAEDAGLTMERTEEISKHILQEVIAAAQEEGEIETTEIRKIILRELDRLEPSVSAAWRGYDKAKGLIS